MKQTLMAMGVISSLILLSVGGFWLMELRLTPLRTPRPTPTPLPKLPVVVADAAIRRYIPIAELARPNLVKQWHGVSENIALSPDGRWFTQYGNSGLEIKRTANWKRFRLLGKAGSAFAFSRDFRLWAKTDLGNRIEVRRVRDNKLLHSLDGARSIYWPLSFSPDNKQLAAIGLPEWLTSREGPTDGYLEPIPKELRIWKLDGTKSPKLRVAPSLDLDEGISIFWTNQAKSGQVAQWTANSPAGFGDSTLVASHTISVRVAGKKIEARDATTGEVLSRVQCPSKMGPLALAPDATLFAGADAADPFVYVWRLTDGKLLHTIKRPNAKKALDLAFSSDSKQLAISFLDSSAPANTPTAARKGETIIYALNRKISRRNQAGLDLISRKRLLYLSP